MTLPTAGETGRGTVGRPGREAPAHRPSRLEVVKDNIEAFAVAIVMALVIKHFCVEAFKIPSGSMLPTLEGNDETGDRILVDKLAYLFHGPERWDVVVFRYPLDGSRNFIKRFLGLPGETIKIAGGDLWVKGPGDQDFHIATKDRRVREQMYVCGRITEDRRIWPPGTGWGTPRDAAESWESEPAAAWRVESVERFEFAGGSNASLTYTPEVTGGTSHESARDARVVARVTADAPASIGWSWRAGEDLVVEVRVSSTGFGPPSAFGIRRGGGLPQETPLDLSLEVGRPVEIEAECVDGEWIVSSNGEEKGRLSLGLRLADASSAPEAPRRLVFRAAGGALRVEDLRIERDLHYLEGSRGDLRADGSGVAVPEDSYFAMGDNTSHSSDSRAWTRECISLRDGREICYDGTDSKARPRAWDAVEDGPAPPWLMREGARIRHVVDVQGIERWWDAIDEDHDQKRSEPLPFVHRDMIVGRAFFIFWPLIPHFPNRLGFIH